MPWNNVRRGSCPSSFDRGAPIVRYGSCSSRVITEATGQELTLDDRFTLSLDQRATRPCPSSFVRVLMTGRSRLVSGNDVRALFLHQRCSGFHADSASALRRDFLPHVKLWCLGACVKFGFCSSGVPHGQYRPARRGEFWSNLGSMYFPIFFQET